MTDFAERHALPDGTAPRLEDTQVRSMLSGIPGWTVEGDKLTRDVQVQNFRAALALVNAIGEVAEEENHHPDLTIHRWNRVRIELYTHTANGVSENDIIMAAKFNRLIPTGG